MYKQLASKGTALKKNLVNEESLTLTNLTVTETLSCSNISSSSTLSCNDIIVNGDITSYNTLNCIGDFHALNLYASCVEISLPTSVPTVQQAIDGTVYYNGSHNTLLSYNDTEKSYNTPCINTLTGVRPSTLFTGSILSDTKNNNLCVHHASGQWRYAAFTNIHI